MTAEFTVDTELPCSVEGAIRLDDQGQFHPRKYCLGLAAAIDGDDSQVFEAPAPCRWRRASRAGSKPTTAPSPRRR